MFKLSVNDYFRSLAKSWTLTIYIEQLYLPFNNRCQISEISTFEIQVSGLTKSMTVSLQQILVITALKAQSNLVRTMERLKPRRVRFQSSTQWSNCKWATFCMICLEYIPMFFRILREIIITYIFILYSYIINIYLY